MERRSRHRTRDGREGHVKRLESRSPSYTAVRTTVVCEAASLCSASRMKDLFLLIFRFNAITRVVLRATPPPC